MNETKKRCIYLLLVVRLLTDRVALHVQIGQTQEGTQGSDISPLSHHVPAQIQNIQSDTTTQRVWDRDEFVVIETQLFEEGIVGQIRDLSNLVMGG